MRISVEASEDKIYILCIETPNGVKPMRGLDIHCEKTSPIMYRAIVMKNGICEEIIEHGNPSSIDRELIKMGDPAANWAVTKIMY